MILPGSVFLSEARIYSYHLYFYYYCYLNDKTIFQRRFYSGLADRYLGPFEVIAVVGTHRQAYKLKLPPTYRIHPVFHVSILEPYHPRTNGSEETPAPIDIEGESGEFWEVEAILAHRDKNKSIGREYYVRWKGFVPTEDSWEPAKSFYDQTMVAEYKRTAGDQAERPQESHKRPRTTTRGIKPCCSVASTRLSIGTLGSTNAVFLSVSIFKTRDIALVSTILFRRY
jgi:hypothetical protein